MSVSHNLTAASANVPVRDVQPRTNLSGNDDRLMILFYIGEKD
jgi:hypothetical protein